MLPKVILGVIFIASCSPFQQVQSARVTYRSCSEVPAQSGLYWITPAASGVPFQVYCEQEHYGGNWMVLQNRQDGSIGFNRTWNEYKYGFGDLRNNFWLGLDKMHQITTSAGYDLMVVMENFYGFMAFQKYENFRVLTENEQYSLDLSEHNTGTAGESLYIYNGEKFSTFDRDNDATSINCASEMGSGFWHYDCRKLLNFKSNLNGLYSEHIRSDGSGIWWGNFGGTGKPLKRTRMMIKLRG